MLSKYLYKPHFIQDIRVIDNEHKLSELNWKDFHQEGSPNIIID
jgi:hypothetical protein